MLLITRPAYELPTRYVSAWAQEVVDVAQRKGITVTELGPDRSTRKIVESVLVKRKPSLVMFNGHGSSSTIHGQDGEILIQAEDNEKTLHGSITYVVACDSAKQLGPAAVTAGAKAFIGYDRSFIFVANQHYARDPLKDSRAFPFFNASNMVMISLLKKHTVEESYRKSQDIFVKNISRLSTSEASSDDLFDAQVLNWNMKSQKYLGDGEARLV